MGVLFLCTGNSCRSQMAEGFFRSLAGGQGVWSAGTHPMGVHPLTVEVMKEAGVDISSHTSKGIGDVPLDKVGTIVTLCADAASCPVPADEATRIHWPIPDPVAAAGPDGEVLEGFRRVRDQIRVHVLELVRAHGAREHGGFCCV